MEDKSPGTMNATTRHGVILLMAAVMPIMAIISLVPVLPLLLQEFESTPGSQFLVPIALTVPALCVALFSPLAGWLSDRVGRKKLLVTALLLYAAAGILPLMLSQLTHIIASRVILGVAEAAIMTVATALIGDYFAGERREKWIAVQIAVGSVSAIVLIAVGGFLGEAFGSRGPFLLYLVAIPLALAAALILFEPVRAAQRAGYGAVKATLAPIMPLVAITLGVGIIFYTVIVQLGPILQLAGPASPAQIGIVGAIANLGVAFGSLLFRLGRARAGPFLLAMGLGLATVGYAGAGMSGGFAAIAFFAVVACIGSGLMLPNMLSWLMRLLPAEMRGRGTGIWTGAFFLGQFIAPLIATAIAGRTQGLETVLQIYAVLAGIGALLAYIASRRRVTAPSRHEA
jgi:MFS family permease